MREILFRGKARSGLHAGKFIYGYFVKDFWKPRKGYGIHPIDEELGGYCEVDPETIGQYTGITDKNGKRIFEGDIVRYTWVYTYTAGCREFIETHSVIGSVVYEDVHYVLDNDYSRCISKSGQTSWFEVVGNIYDNNLDDFKRYEKTVESY